MLFLLLLRLIDPLGTHNPRLTSYLPNLLTNPSQSTFVCTLLNILNMSICSNRRTIEVMQVEVDVDVEIEVDVEVYS